MVQLAVISDRLSSRGGADQYLQQVVTWCVEAGHDVTLWVGRRDGTAEPPSGVQVKVARPLARATADTRGLATLEDALGTTDVAIVQNVMNPCVLEVLASVPRVVAIVQDHRIFCPGPGKTLPDGAACHDPLGVAPCDWCLPEPRYRRDMLALTNARLGRTREWTAVVLSDYMERELRTVGFGDVRVVPPWVEPGSARRDPGDTFLIGGRLVRHKAVREAWTCWEQAGRPLTLAVAGEGPEARLLPDCRNLGWLDPAALKDALRRARALLFPARWQEPFGILGLEALAQGTPVIATDVGGVGDWLGSGCHRVAAGDWSAMSDAIRWSAGHPEACLEEGERGRRRVSASFSRARFGRRLAAALDLGVG